MDNQAYSQNLGFVEIPLPDTNVSPSAVRTPAPAHPISNHTLGESTSKFFTQSGPPTIIFVPTSRQNSNFLTGPMNNHGKAPRENNLRTHQPKSSNILVPKPTRQSDKKIHYDYIFDSNKYQLIQDNIKTKLSNFQINMNEKTIETTTTPPRNVSPSVIFPVSAFSNSGNMDRGRDSPGRYYRCKSADHVFSKGPYKHLEN